MEAVHSCSRGGEEAIASSPPFPVRTPPATPWEAMALNPRRIPPFRQPVPGIIGPWTPDTTPRPHPSSPRCAMSTIVFSHVSFSYGTLPVLDNVSFTCGPVDRLVVVGPNGIGKSTLLALAAGRLQPDSGTITGPPLSPTPLVPPVPGRLNSSRHQACFPLLSLRSQRNTVATRSHSSSMTRLPSPEGWRRASTPSPSASPGAPPRATRRSTTASWRR